MINNGKKYHYLAINNLFALLQGKSSDHYGDLYCLNCFNSYTTKNKHEEICNNHESCRIEIPKWVEKNIKIQFRKKIIKSTICNLSRFRMFIEKRTISRR